MRALLLLVNVLEDVFEAAIVGFQDGVLGTHVERPALLDGVLEAAVSESPDRLHNQRSKPQKLQFFFYRKKKQPSRHVALTSSVLYIPIPQPPDLKSYTSHSFCLLPSVGVKVILNLPGWSTVKSVALYWEIKTTALDLRDYARLTLNVLLKQAPAALT